MKIIFTAILLTVAFCACNSEVKTETVGNSTNPAVVDNSEAQSALFSQTTVDSTARQQKSSSLIGKTTIEIENMGWFKKDSMVDRYVDWLGNSYKKNNEEVLNKRWRNYTYWDRYTDKQFQSLTELLKELCQKYNISKDFIGHNVFDDNVDLFKGITFRSNYYQESTDVSPAFDMEILKNI